MWKIIKIGKTNSPEQKCIKKICKLLKVFLVFRFISKSDKSLITAKKNLRNILQLYCVV